MQLSSLPSDMPNNTSPGANRPFGTSDSVATPSSDPITTGWNTAKGPQSMYDITSHFYTDLFRADPIDQDAADSLQHLSLLTLITVDDLLAQAARCSTSSSPGHDGLGYPFLSLLFSHSPVGPIALAVNNDALSSVVFPASWQDICMLLLPKKGDLSLLKNWRPISLINCDGKAFTRLPNARIAPITGEILTPYQAGFIPRRFIAGNFFLLRMIMSRSHHTATEAISLLLDQEKAYDRVHPGYLEQALAPFGFPSMFIQPIVNLFYHI